MQRFLLVALLILTQAGANVPAGWSAACPPARYVILMVGDGMGYNHILAAQQYQGLRPVYADWPQTWVSTYPAGGGYDPDKTWSSFDQALQSPTDSAAAATALSTGIKTENQRIGTAADGTRLTSLADLARAAGKAVGAVTSVPISHATPGGWLAHNDSRANGFAIADESLWGDPNTTGAPADNPAYGGGHGPSLPPADVLIGGGHPAWSSGSYVNAAIRDRLAAQAAEQSGLAFVERQAGSPNGGQRLLQAAANPATRRLVGLFGGSSGNLDNRLADGSGANPENPSLAQMTQAALQVLSRDPDGFVLLIEGGAVDWGAHANRMDIVVGEVIGFNQAVQAVSDWVDDPASPATWSNTLVIVTADHETGYLTLAPGQFPDQIIGPVTPTTLTLEKSVSGTGLRASWDDTDGDERIDTSENVYWAWNTSGHSNSLVRLYARGPGAPGLVAAAAQVDPRRGRYLDNTQIFPAMQTAAFTASCKVNFLPVTVYHGP